MLNTTLRLFILLWMCDTETNMVKLGCPDRQIYIVFKIEWFLAPITNERELLFYLRMDI